MIRQARVEDFDSIIYLWRKTGVVHGDTRDYQKLLLEKVSKEPDLVLVYEDKGMIAGAMVGLYDPFVCYLRLGAVHVEWQRQGIATKLVNAMVKNLKKRGGTAVASLLYMWNNQSFGLMKNLGWEQLDDCYCFAIVLKK